MSQAKKGFMTINFDIFRDVDDFMKRPDSGKMSYVVIAYEHIPENFKSVFDNADFSKTFLLYVVFAKKEEYPVTMFRDENFKASP